MGRRSAIASCAGVLLLCAAPAMGEDEIDSILRRAQLPVNPKLTMGYSDHTDPLGRFLDMLAFGAAADAKALKPAACKRWLETRQDSVWSGKFWVRNVEVNLNTLCGGQ
ncbi:MAG: hypothetical protein JSS43_11200 [Proteobacteria bacterium]|nr:hypothetical protein [Pseudomonadota bacterium]